MHIVEMATQRKARSSQDKADRRDELLRVAAVLFDTVPYAKITMAEVAQRAGLAKGTVYLYFASKEELFLGVLEKLLFAWHDALDQRLDVARGAISADQLVEMLALRSPGSRTLTGLLAIVSGVLEHNVSVEVASRYKPQLWSHMMKTGAKLEAKWPHFRAGEGFQFLGHLALFIIGGRQLADLSPVVLEVVKAFNLKGFRADFDTELDMLVRNHLRGLENRLREIRATSGAVKKAPTRALRR
jgi:AcrR family transcriptional regulator